VAVLCSGRGSSSALENLDALVGFFGVPRCRVVVDETVAASAPMALPSRFCVLSSASAMAGLGQSGGQLPAWMTAASSVYLYGFEGTAECKTLLRFLSGDTNADVRTVNGPPNTVSITNALPGMCGPLSGLHIALPNNECKAAFHFPAGEGIERIITVTEGDVFVSLVCQGVRFYLNACRDIIDIHACLPKRFDVKDRFFSAVPATMYVRYAFQELCPAAGETSACLIVDDPTLSPRYGFLHFGEALRLMEARNFTTTIAFIPWNWRRTRRGIVNLFQQHPERFSLAVHGCDHTASEFATRSVPLLNRRIKTAIERMNRLFQRTSLRHESVMVFPQGRFSPESAHALKVNGFVAAANSEVAPFGDGNRTEVADVWDVAIMKYGTFPIFTRRYPSDGIENFAFDGLLGKPCLIVAHHEQFQGNDLGDFITRLNSLRWNLRWRTLGNAILRSCAVRRQSDGVDTLRMYGGCLVFEHGGTELREMMVIKEEADSGAVIAVTVNGKRVDWVPDGGFLKFRVQMSPGDAVEIAIQYSDRLGVIAGRETLPYAVRAGLRRYLSELRDNYVSQNRLLRENARRIRGLWT
jgi:hypothetical protein